MIKLYGVPASRAFRCLWMLEELGLEYENVPTHYATGDCKKPEYLALNPNGHIPTLVDGETVLWESMAINLYLAAKYDGGLQPKSVADLGHAIKWSFWVMTETEKLLLEVLMHRFILPEDRRDAGAAQKALADLAGPLGVLDRELDGRSHLAGGGFTVADLNVASVLSWLVLGQVDLSKTPNVQRWLTACMARPAVDRVRGGS